ncbi:type II toxin-antitoxin system HipA family toxin [Cupriavidus taiwanensis]|uniref:HipA-like C-terminal domain protein n=1 Tax=Cupriavidus taiwanensis TaxID=164546 RepID=A0A7Z7JIT9_9BURK|nr:HipA domain-containing protein [Cupriavidus taiwanensis]SOZ19159.1 HipA-like C-terminal domain protein [Cupriavidus taiwanensis]SOZ97209.1 HipA-like C-terminal domain protein [Cupriavidus taiwanensis]SPC26100.1 HipA-like C-terminal domain protein [Cupriavidus taiwanensis]SPD37767.1 HipA-like C-terminal domain protein [Cupriavidus taiwanensis]
MPRSNLRDKDVESPLYVYTVLAGRLAWVGTLNLDDSRGEVPMPILADFTYARSYLADPEAYPLDPLNLPLRDQVFRTTSRFHVLGALFDAAPDAWGRNVIRADNAGIMPSEREVFVRGRGLGVGSLLFAARLLEDGADLTEILRARRHAAGLDDIPTLETALAAIDAGQSPDDAWRDLLASSWDIGGARPKAIVRDAAGELWIAKFPRARDSFDRQRLEWANLEMARAIGMDVPQAQLVEGEHGAILMVRRFDRAATGQGTLRRHYLSAASLISPSPTFDKRDMDRPQGVATFSYARVADVIKRISSNPARDLQELYARMVLNVAVHNTDDHLKNTGFLKEEAGPTGRYRLSPLFDVVTQEGSAKHMLHIGPRGRESTFENAVAGAARMNIKPKAAQEIVGRVQDVTSHRHEYYARAGLADEEMEVIDRCLSAWHDLERGEEDVEPAPVARPRG